MSDRYDSRVERPSKRRRRDSYSSSSSIHEDRRRNIREEKRQAENGELKHDSQSRRRERDDDGRKHKSERERSVSSEDDHEERRRSSYSHKSRHGKDDSRDGEERRRKSRRQSRSRSRSRSRDRRFKRERSRDRSRNRDKDRDYDSKRPDKVMSSKTKSKSRHDRRYSRSRSRSLSRSPRQAHQRSKKPLPSQNDAFHTTSISTPTNPSNETSDKQKPNFGLTGKLAAASNTIQTGNQTIVLKYHEPPESRKPPANQQWRLYVFKDDQILDTVELGEQSCWLFGREVSVADFPIQHSSCSKQHAVIQFRHIEKRNEFGDRLGKVKPYVIDLESSNGTFVNDERIPVASYYELVDKDVLRFGSSTREYVIQLPPK